MQDSSNEILEAYSLQYSLDDNLPAHYKKQVLFLVTSLRELKRLNFADRKEALRAHAKVEKWLAEKQVFHRHSHQGYNELLDLISRSLTTLQLQINEKFPGES